MILFAVNDAGPARYIAHIVRELDGIPYICLASDISSKIFDEFNIEYIVDENSIDISKIGLIFTGTSLGWCIDKRWLEVGREMGVYTISIIEHWSLYKKRFEIGSGRYIFPNSILVNDDLAKREAIEDGIDERLLKVVGNPVLENIERGDYSYRDGVIWRKSLNLPLDRRVVTFISEQYRDDFPIGSKEYVGFDEFRVLDDILNSLNGRDTLLIKLHPKRVEINIATF